MCFFCGYTFPHYLSTNSRKLCIIPNCISLIEEEILGQKWQEDQEGIGGNLEEQDTSIEKSVALQKMNSSVCETVCFIYFCSAPGIDVLDTAKAKAIHLVLSFGNYSLQIRALHLLRPHASGDIIN